MIFDNHRPLPKYVEHDPAEERRCCDAADQPIKYWYLLTPSPEPRFAQKLNDSRQWDASKYLEGANSAKHKAKRSNRKIERVCRKLTLQLVAS
jgi:hypothetical protein